MKKLTLSVAALSIALTTFGQVNTTDVVLPEYEVREMINTIDDILEWQQQDMEDGETNMGSYEEGWGSNYWLTIMREELIIAINSSKLK
tara:strand:+ start:265 stop:531 length:267 start_codon:yes stop_codon:yes gene_type:complete